MADSIIHWSAEACQEFLSKPKSSDHKYRRGILGCITGSKSYPGAALLTTSSALAVGIGMVRYFGPERVKRAVIQHRPEVVLQTGKVDAYLLGSGIPNKRALFRRITMELANRTEVAKVLDAGALYLTGSSKGLTIITPHVGELAALLKLKPSEIEADPVGIAIDTANRFGITVLLKGSQTIVTNGKLTILLPIATPWLATAGTGDVLAGILGALLALNHDKLNKDNLVEIGATAAFIHAESAKLSSEGPVSPSEMIEYIPKTIIQITK